MSSTEGAGSTEQISTAVPWRSRVLNPRAAEIVVFPTPPLPKTIVRDRSKVGHSARDSRASRGFGFGGAAFQAKLLPAKIWSPKVRSSGPIAGAPASSAVYRSFADNGPRRHH